MWEGVGDRIELQHIDTHSYSHQRFFPVLLGCSTGGLGQSLSGCWFSLPHLISNWSGLQTDWSGAGGLPLLGAGFLYRILYSTGLVSKLTDCLSSPSHIIVHARLLLVGVTNCTRSTHPRSRQHIHGQGNPSTVNTLMASSSRQITNDIKVILMFHSFISTIIIYIILLLWDSSKML